ncbi:MAG: pilus assembly protein [Armatimonadetes bacterium]|nr:pilus assembly protein [Armatimonadota bacterium]MDW8026776.1 pilus assembly protein [Armatimonadota bacterium]
MKLVQTLTEFAISVAAVLVLMVNLMELGRYIFAINTLRNAVREGARYAIVHLWDEEGIRQSVRRSVTGINPNLISFQVNFSPPHRSSGSIVNISATYPFQSVFGVFRRTFTVSATMKVS